MSVTAEFQTASGQRIPGFVVVSTDPSFEVEAGILLYEAQYLSLPSVNAGSATKSHDRISRAIDKAGGTVFPVKFTLHALVDGEKEFRTGEFR